MKKKVLLVVLAFLVFVLFSYLNFLSSTGSAFRWGYNPESSTDRSGEQNYIPDEKYRAQVYKFENLNIPVELRSGDSIIFNEQGFTFFTASKVKYGRMITGRMKKCYVEGSRVGRDSPEGYRTGYITYGLSKEGGLVSPTTNARKETILVGAVCDVNKIPMYIKSIVDNSGTDNDRVNILLMEKGFNYVPRLKVGEMRIVNRKDVTAVNYKIMQYELGSWNSKGVVHVSVNDNGKLCDTTIETNKKGDACGLRIAVEGINTFNDEIILTIYGVESVKIPTQ